MALSETMLGCFHRHALAHVPGLVAVSGGPDSVALAHLCLRLVHDGQLAGVCLAHLNHQLRGADSDGDEAFVLSLPRLWNVPTLRVVSHRVDVAGRARRTNDNLEQAGRAARYEWLTDAAQMHNAAWIATGHTADDQAETVLHHFLRGSGPAGLAGIPETRTPRPGITLIRPLLAVRRSALLDYLRQNQVVYRHDATNDDARFLRNRLRHDLLPKLVEGYNPALVEVLCRTAQQMRDVNDELVRQAQALLLRTELPRAAEIVVLERRPLQEAPPVLLRELFRALWQREDWPMGEMTFEDWNRLAALAHGSATGQHFPGGVQAKLAGRVLQLARSL